MKQFIRGLLAATCLTVAGSGIASATTFFESGVGDCPNTSPGTSLPVGTDTLNGSITPSSDLDFFECMGLAAGQSFMLTGSTILADFFMSAFNSGNTQLGTPQELFFSHNAIITGTIPNDGLLIVELPSSNAELTTGAYTVTLLVAPEPATVALTGLGLAAAAALARRRKTEE